MAIASFAFQNVSYADYNIDCNINSKGCLLKQNSDTLIIFFRGWVHPDEMYKYSGLRKQLDASSWQASGRDLLLNTPAHTPLAELNLISSIFAVGSAHVGLSETEMDELLEASGASYIIFASHSGGYVGLRNTILPASLDYWKKVAGIWLLDNFYAGPSFADDLRRNFGEEFLRVRCYGFVTAHNYDRFSSYLDGESYQSLCPKIITSGVGHSDGVGTCLPYFEKGRECLN